MFNVGGGEILVILIVALVVLGPDKLPGAVRQAGRVLGEIRRISSGFQAEMRDAMGDTGSPPTRVAVRPSVPPAPDGDGSEVPPSDPGPASEDTPASGSDSVADAEAARGAGSEPDDGTEAGRAAP